MMEPHEIAARDFMRHKGYPDLEPNEIRETGRFRWEFLYELPEGDLRLRVQWLEGFREWRVRAVDFALTE